jgi:hypothetical protein
MTQLRTAVALAVSVIAFTGATPLKAQEEPPPAGPCRTITCHIHVVWGPEGMPTRHDRRYGVVGEFESRMVRHLESAGLRFVVADSKTTLTFTLRPKVVRAMCDVMSGTDTDMSCQMISEVEVEVHNPDPAVKVSRSMRIRNRCGDDQLTDIAKFSEYSAGMIAYELSLDPKRKRPTNRC